MDIEMMTNMSKILLKVDMNKIILGFHFDLCLNNDFPIKRP